MIKKGTIDFTAIDFFAGEILLINKDIGDSSFDVIRRLRKIIGVRKIGHAGTLDPFASGLLILCTGKKTKEINKYQNFDKTYTGTITLGKTTATMDPESEVIKQTDITDIDENSIYNIRNSFLGQSYQIPPMYSALKYKGKALYKYARKGIEIYREPREIYISKFDLLKIDLPDLFFELVCSKGTYVRVIANDFGEKLNCGAYLSSLRRTKIGDYSVEEALKIDDLHMLFQNKNSIKEVIN